jgi:putative transposase
MRSMLRARAALANWRSDYNQNRPHSRLGWRTPTEFAETFMGRGPALRKANGFAPAHNIHRSQPEKTNRQSELRAG